MLVHLSWVRNCIERSLLWEVKRWSLQTGSFFCVMRVHLILLIFIDMRVCACVVCVHACVHAYNIITLSCMLDTVLLKSTINIRS